VLAALVMICLLAAVAGVVAWRTGALGGTKPAVQAGSGDRGSPEAHFAGLLAAVALGHSLVEGAVAAACTTTPPASAARAAQLARAERGGASYRSVQQQLAADRPSLDEVPSGRVLAGDLGRTTAAELEAEQAYSAWLEDLQATGCYSAPTNDLNYELASQASLSAALAAVKLAATWAGVAPRYHLQTWSAADL
jgi:hypothetical protein